MTNSEVEVTDPKAYAILIKHFIMLRNDDSFPYYIDDNSIQVGSNKYELTANYSLFLEWISKMLECDVLEVKSKFLTIRDGNPAVNLLKVESVANRVIKH